MQKSIRRDFNMNEFFNRAYSQTVYRSDGGARLTCSGPEGRKIMLAHEATGRRPHPANVQRLADPPGSLPEQRGPGRAVKNRIAISTLGG